MRRVLIIATASALLATACGQFAGVHEEGVASGETASGGVGVPGATDGTTGTGTTGTGTTGTGTTGAGTTGTGGTTISGGGSGTSGGTGTPTGGDATGVTVNLIRFGIHAPLTGAAPLRAESFNTGKDLYWDHGNNLAKVLIYGRGVEVVFQDDQYNPSHAKQVCQQMAEQQEAFDLVGGGGTDQIQACAIYAASRGIPYLSAGVTEKGIRGLNNYFALSMSYAQQGPLLASYIKKVLKVTDPARVAMVATDTPNFDDAVDAFQGAFPGVKVFRPAKNERGNAMAGNLCIGTQQAYDVVYPLVAPTYYLEMAHAAACHPQYAGVGITNGLDQVASTGCEGDRATENARFFSPAPAFQDSDRYDRAFRQAAAKAGTSGDDIMFLLWGLSKSVHQLFLKAGQNLTREGFIAASSNASVHTGVYPDLRYTPDNHFGASQVHVLKNVCQRRGSAAGYYVTESDFNSSF